MLSKTFFVMILLSFVCAVYTGNVSQFSQAVAVSFSGAVEVCISLAGMMCFWQGTMSVLRDAGAMRVICCLLKPVFKLIYSKEALEKNTLENLSASVSANFLGLGNAALPLGIKTVEAFEKNNKSDFLTDNTVMFAVLNTVPFQLIPATLVALRQKYGSETPFDVVPYIWICSLIINVFAVFVCKLFSKLWRR